MHEMGIALQIVEIAAERSAGARVVRVIVEIGKLAAVLPDAVRFCFDAASEGTLLEGAMLDILETPGRARCRACAGEVVLERPLGRCACGSADLEWLSGDELTVRGMELA
jgi:hydrogenase nickel incorporation protein HypA/HybF